MPRPGEGLTSREAASLLARFGPNALPAPHRRGYLRIAYDVVRQPMFALLLAAAGIYSLAGEMLDTIALLAFATLSASIGVLQEARSERVLESLRQLSSPTAAVVRDGKAQRIPSTAIVPGDLLLLAEGDRPCADAVVERSDDLVLDESLLTGESLPVRKSPMAAEKPDAQEEDSALVHAGTMVVRGGGEARVVETGIRTEFGRIGQALQSVSFEQPVLQKQLRWLVRDFALAGLLVAAGVALLAGLRRGAWLEAGLAGIAIGMSVLPEEFPLVVSVFMAMGASRISRAGVLTRRAAAIETLGCATVLCSDKTGTMTENRMRVALLSAQGDQADHPWRAGSGRLPQALEPLLKAAAGASGVNSPDPMDIALNRAAETLLRPDRERNATLIKTYGITPDLPAVTMVWKTAGGERLIFAKGAPETIMRMCGLDEARTTQILRQVDQEAEDGLRILAVATGRLSDATTPLPVSQRDFAWSYGGLVGFKDPLRPGIKAAIEECRAASIRVIMITGDYPATARSIAREAGLDVNGLMTGGEMDRLDAAQLAAALDSVSVFCRIKPVQKLRIVEALKQRGEIVAMTGDGVNDTPALKAAHIGVAMGARGSDVAREAASLVLIRDDFASLVAAIRMGRRIYDNLLKAIQYIIAVHIPIAGMAVLPLVMGLPAMLGPIHIAFMEMIIDPACSIVFESEPEERDLMHRPPRRSDRPLLSTSVLRWALLQGLAGFAVAACVLAAGRYRGMSEAHLRALVFATLVAGNVVLIFVNRAMEPGLSVAFWRPNRAFMILLAAIVLLLALSLGWQPARRLFDFETPALPEAASCLLAILVLTAGLQLGKRLFRPGAQSRT